MLFGHGNSDVPSGTLTTQRCCVPSTWKDRAKPPLSPLSPSNSLVVVISHLYNPFNAHCKLKHVYNSLYPLSYISTGGGNWHRTGSQLERPQPTQFDQGTSWDLIFLLSTSRREKVAKVWYQKVGIFRQIAHATQPENLFCVWSPWKLLRLFYRINLW